MPLRAPKMYGFIFGFQRLVWWPKCTPASSSWRMVMDCAGAIACCMAAAGGAEASGVWTFSLIVLLLHLRRAGAGPVREPRADQDVGVVSGRQPRLSALPLIRKGRGI